MGKVKRITAINCLGEIVGKGSARMKQLTEWFQKGEIPAGQLHRAAKYHASLKKVHQILIDCPMELDELHEMLKGIKSKEPRHYRLHK